MAIALHTLSNNDLPLHIATGDYVLAHGIPTTDPFSFTAGGRPWVPHEWLAGVLFALARQLAGDQGLVWLNVLLAGVLAALVAGVGRELKASVTSLCLWGLPVWVMVGQRLILRPHMFQLCLAAALWWLILRARTHRHWLWGLPAAMALWVNVHGSFVLGYGICLLGLFAHWRAGVTPRSQLKICFGLTTLALCAQFHVWRQPDIWAGFRDALFLVTDPVFMAEIQEWQPPFTSTAFQRSYAFWISLPFLGIAAYSVVRPGRPVPLSYRLYTLGCFLLYFRHQRFIALAALATLPLLPDLLHGITTRTARRLALALALACASATLYVTLGFPVYIDQKLRRPGLSWDGDKFPIYELEALRKDSKRGAAVFCEYDYGGIVIWFGFRPTMDSRNSVYGAEQYVLHQQALAVDSVPDSETGGAASRARAYREELLEQVDAVLIRGAIVEPLRTGLQRRLQGDPKWRLHTFSTAGHYLYVRVD
ncbi:MAG: hypothetical protein ACKVX7_07440 [Planctomycetota bacterium]